LTRSPDRRFQSAVLGHVLRTTAKVLLNVDEDAARSPSRLEPHPTHAEQPIPHLALVWRVLRKHAPLARLVQLDEKSIDSRTPGIEEAWVEPDAFAGALPFDERRGVRDAVAGHQARQVRLELPRREQVDARGRRPQHVQQLLRRRLLLEEPELVLREAA